VSQGGGKGRNLADPSSPLSGVPCRPLQPRPLQWAGGGGDPTPYPLSPTPYTLHTGPGVRASPPIISPNSL